MRRDGTSSRATPPPPRVDARGSRPRHRIKGDPNVGSEQRTRETGAGDAPGRAERARGDAGGERRGAAGRRWPARARRGPWRCSWRGPASSSSGVSVSLDVSRRGRLEPELVRIRRSALHLLRHFSSASPRSELGLSQPRTGESRSSHGDRDALFVSTGNNTYLWTICTCVKNRQRANPGRFASRRGEWFATPRSIAHLVSRQRSPAVSTRSSGPRGLATLSGEHPRRAIARTALLQSRIGPSQETAPEIR